MNAAMSSVPRARARNKQMQQLNLRIIICRCIPPFSYTSNSREHLISFRKLDQSQTEQIIQLDTKTLSLFAQIQASTNSLGDSNMELDFDVIHSIHQQQFKESAVTVIRSKRRRCAGSSSSSSRLWKEKLLNKADSGWKHPGCCSAADPRHS